MKYLPELWLLLGVLIIVAVFSTQRSEVKPIACIKENYHFRARVETLIVCREERQVFYWDSAAQGDSARQIMISVLLEELE